MYLGQDDGFAYVIHNTITVILIFPKPIHDWPSNGLISVWPEKKNNENDFSDILNFLIEYNIM